MWKEDAIARREFFSPFVTIEDAAQACKTDPGQVVGKKVEVRWLMEADKEHNGAFIHCFEGTVIKVLPYAAGRKSQLQLDFGCHKPAALVKWDPEFNWSDANFPLDLDAYAKEDRHYGWNVLTDAYAAAYSGS